MNERDWPSEGELVVCTVANVKDFVAFVKLDEYGGRQGLIPISEVATGWVKYIRDFIREGQKVVCKVLNVDPSRGHIDLSLKDVNDHQRREKIREWKNEQKAKKWIGFVSQSTGAPPEQLQTAIYQKYGFLYSFFEDAAIHGEDALKGLTFERKVADALLENARTNVRIPRVTISGYLDLTSTKSDGVNIIRRALRSAQPRIADVDIDLIYVGSPTYRIKVTAPDYKQAEKAIEKAATAAIRVMEKAGGTGKFNRKPKTKAA
ncbi:MAG: translation initiation factor IF-2 subunit alpha [Methanomicrobiales archaeon]|nr:translation initiation factor IF-2 subunit alpha [Methanomicrobiales archaeon]